jgi:hypothetical protein
LLETLDESIKRVLQDAKFEDRSVDEEQFQVLMEVYNTLAGLIEGDKEVTLHPAFSAGYVTIKVSDVKLDTAEVTTLRAALANCTALSIEPLANGNVEIGVTVPDVFSPLAGGTTE